MRVYIVLGHDDLSRPLREHVLRPKKAGSKSLCVFVAGVIILYSNIFYLQWIGLVSRGLENAQIGFK